MDQHDQFLRRGQGSRMEHSRTDSGFGGCPPMIHLPCPRTALPLLCAAFTAAAALAADQANGVSNGLG
jgi:hypothetical protein